MPECAGSKTCTYELYELFELYGLGYWLLVVCRLFDWEPRQWVELEVDRSDFIQS